MEKRGADLYGSSSQAKGETDYENTGSTRPRSDTASLASEMGKVLIGVLSHKTQRNSGFSFWLWIHTEPRVQRHVAMQCKRLEKNELLCRLKDVFAKIHGGRPALGP